MGQLLTVTERQEAIISELKRETENLKLHVCSLEGSLDFVTTEGMFRALKFVCNAFSMDVCSSTSLDALLSNVSEQIFFNSGLGSLLIV